MLSALAPYTAAVAIKIPLRNLSQLLSWPACLKEAVLLDAMQHFQNTAFGRARLAHAYTIHIGEGHDQRIDRLCVHLPPIAGIVLLHSLLREQQGEGELWQAQAFKLEWKPMSEEKSLPARLSGKKRQHAASGESNHAAHNSLDASHVWITKFVKLPKNTVGSFVMTFNTDAVADLLGVEEANTTDRLQN